jgi:hypothetical protein
MGLQVILKPERFEAPEMGAIDALLGTPRNSPAKLKVVGNPKYSSIPGFESQWRVMVTFFYEFGTTHAVEKRLLKNLSPDTHPSIEV